MLAVNATPLCSKLPNSGDWRALEKVGKKESSAPCGNERTNDPHRYPECWCGENTPVEEQDRQFNKRKRRDGHELQGQEALADDSDQPAVLFHDIIRSDGAHLVEDDHGAHVRGVPVRC